VFKPLNGSLLTRNIHKKIIDTLTGEQGQRAGESFTSVTRDLEASRILDHDKYGSRIVLLDTPGFDDTERTDEEILRLIGEWLQTTYVESNPRVPYYPNDHICVDTRKKYYCRELCMCNESLIRGCPQHPTGISSCSQNSLVPEVQRTSSLPPQCGILLAPSLMPLERRGSTA